MVDGVDDEQVKLKSNVLAGTRWQGSNDARCCKLWDLPRCYNVPKYRARARARHPGWALRDAVPKSYRPPKQLGIASV